MLNDILKGEFKLGFETVFLRAVQPELHCTELTTSLGLPVQPYLLVGIFHNLVVTLLSDLLFSLRYNFIFSFSTHEPPASMSVFTHVAFSISSGCIFLCFAHCLFLPFVHSAVCSIFTCVVKFCVYSFEKHFFFRTELFLHHQYFFLIPICLLETNRSYHLQINWKDLLLLFCCLLFPSKVDCYLLEK